MLENKSVSQLAKILLTYAFVFLLPALTCAQTIFYTGEIQLTSGQSQEMDSFFNSYTAFDFNTQALYDYVKDTEDSVSFSIHINDALHWVFHLKEKDILSDNFVLMYMTQSGEHFASHKGKTNTYQGYVEGSSNGAAFFHISKDKLIADITHP